MFDESPNRLYGQLVAQLIDELRDIPTTPHGSNAATKMRNDIETAIEDVVMQPDIYESPVDLNELPNHIDVRGLLISSPHISFGDEYTMYIVRHGERVIPGETEHDDLITHRVQLDVLYCENGDIAINAIAGAGNRNVDDTFLFCDYIHNIDYETMFRLGAQSVSDYLGAFAGSEVSATEALDFFQTDIMGRTTEDWAVRRNVGYEAVRKSREEARSKLQQADFPHELTAKEGNQLDSRYVAVLSEYETKIDDLVDLLLPDNTETDADRAVLKIVLLESLVPSVMFTSQFESVTLTPQEVRHTLAESDLNAHTRAPMVAKATSYVGMDEQEFASRVVTLRENISFPDDCENTNLLNLTASQD